VRFPGVIGGGGAGAVFFGFADAVLGFAAVFEEAFLARAFFRLV
jgi:Na+/alanine symporter